MVYWLVLGRRGPGPKSESRKFPELEAVLGNFSGNLKVSPRTRANFLYSTFFLTGLPQARNRDLLVFWAVLGTWRNSGPKIVKNDQNDFLQK